eukprot:GILI01013263.1.p1 GENE.GILI01013263.1~~GILI01013263.1.p1  ORF type:complete len:376 (-),score=32.26 GILI01013263.1:189-1271(-)
MVPLQVFNAAADEPSIGDALSLAASPDSFVLPTFDRCGRFRNIAVYSGLLTPMPSVINQLEGEELSRVLLLNLIILAGCTGLGLLTVAGLGLCNGLRGGQLSLLTEQARFPATILQCYLFLSTGTAVAAGLSLGGGSDPLYSSILATLVLLATPVACCVVVYITTPQRVVSEVRKGYVCGYVLPSNCAISYGPIVSDLRVQGLLSPVIPSILPILLLVVTALVAKFGPCEYVPLAVGIVFIVYALAIASVRPFIAVTHLVVEIVVAMAAGVCLIAWYSVLKENEEVELTQSERALVLTVVALSNCRYPFVLARSLSVVLPPVMRRDSSSSDRTDTSQADADSVLEPLVVASGTMQDNYNL